MKKGTLTICQLMLIFLFSPFSHAAVWHVDGGAFSSGDGTSWSSAFKTLEDALAAAASMDEIWIRQGTYQTASEIVISKNVGIFGGFAGFEEKRDERDWKTRQTIVDGKGAARCFSMASSGALDGLRVINCKASGDGGGILITGQNTSVVVKNCIFAGNGAEGRGGAIYNGGGPITIINTAFSGNSSQSHGGGIGTGGSSVARLSSCSLAGNRSVTGNGGGMYIDGDYKPEIKNCTFSGNTAVAGHGGGAFINNSQHLAVLASSFTGNTATTKSGGGLYANKCFFPAVTNSVFADNRAGGQGGAIYFNLDSYSTTTANNTFHANIAGSRAGGGALFFYYNGIQPPKLDQIIRNSILWGNRDDIGPNQLGKSSPVTLYVYHSNVEGGIAGTGNLDSTPLFQDPSKGDLRLQAGSPCIDAGINGSYLPPTDKDAKPRVLDGNGDSVAAVDMGAFEYGDVTNMALIHPVGGETLLTGETYDLSWSSFPAEGLVMIELSRDGGGRWEVISEGTENDGFFEWTATGPDAPACRMRITSVQNPVLTVASAQDFVIGNRHITLVEPKEGHLWLDGDTGRVVWNSLGAGEFVAVEISRDSGATWDAIAASTENDGLYEWPIAGPLSSACRLRVSSLLYPAVSDASSGDFTIAQRYITLLSPNGGDHWLEGTTRLISWESFQAGDTVAIDISRDSGATWKPVTASTANDGTFEWSATGPGATSCRVRVRSLSFPAKADASNTDFTIAPAQVSPQGGEYWIAGENRNIAWPANLISGAVRIEISRDGGAAWSTIAAATENDGLFTWNVTGPESPACRIRVTFIEHPSIAVASSADFAIAVRGITLVAPKGNEIWAEAESYDITWTSKEAGNSIKIELSRNAGTDWETIAAGTENDGVFSWTVTAPDSESCLIRLSSVPYPSVTARSPAPFTVTTDRDNDGMRDLWEMKYFGNLSRNGLGDFDRDGLNDKGEWTRGTDPTNPDSDGDGLPDGYEVANGLNPLRVDALEDADGDGYCNLREYAEGTHPNNPTIAPKPRTIHVDGANVSGTEDGTARHPFDTIQEAIDFAGNGTGEMIWVRTGTYYPAPVIRLNKAVSIYAGFTGAEAKTEDRNWEANVCVIDGGKIEVTAVATIDGFVIRSGSGMTVQIPNASSSAPAVIANCLFENNSSPYSGGAISNSNSAVTVTASTFRENTSAESGGAIFNNYGWISIDFCAFVNNSAGYNGGGAIHNHRTNGHILDSFFTGNSADVNGGGAIMNVSSSPSITGCVFADNHTTYGGGAINNSSNSFRPSDPGSSPIISNCSFAGNSADYVGGAIWNWSGIGGASNPIITNSIFHGNRVNDPPEDGGGAGGAIANAWAAPIITNCTFASNVAPVKGGAIYNNGRTLSYATPTITNSILWGNQAPQGPEISNKDYLPKVTFCDVGGGYSGTGNMNANPSFVDPDGPDDDPATWEDNDFELGAGSPCIDAGSNAAPHLPLTDFQGKARKIDGKGDGNIVADMGAHEFGNVCLGDVDADGDTDGFDLVLVASEPSPGNLANFLIQFGQLCN